MQQARASLVSRGFGDCLPRHRIGFTIALTGREVKGARPRDAVSRSAKGTRPLGFPSFWGWGRVLAPAPYLAGTPCLADTLRKDDRPPTHFFVKKKFSSIGGAETATQRVPSGLCYAHILCGEGLCTTFGIPPRRACERGKVLRLRLSAAQEVPRTEEGAFFFTKKAYCVNQTLCVAGARKSVQTGPPFPSLKRWDSKGTRPRCAASGASQNSASPNS